MAQDKKAAPKKKKSSYSAYKVYKVEGGKVTKPRSCPKCGPAIFMATHSNRMSCGKCGYTEMK
ncbi:30S ribosomal protein S27ae [Candidatus Woesearchaeota archaeon CG1_02_57_44]|nr:MAG: 30S ribosomal protein S27ae [Candidatus Woesearchaeota archaeon CG1_02_57_44]PIN70190.1 MAG: 30S ribosomal protein S27ae [Candidatus Woesearchaeota archaeon CG11_big_fil_rev_8_21_14_0_20_57_5]